MSRTTPTRGLSRTQSKGFASLALILLLVLGLAAFGGAGWWLLRSSLLPPFSATPMSGSAPLTVHFTVAQGARQGYFIDFGDGTRAMNVSCESLPMLNDTCFFPTQLTHTYPKAGVYTPYLLSGPVCLVPVPDCPKVNGTVTISVQ